MNSLILKRELFQKYCTDILSAVDSNELSILTETLELKTLNNTLVMSVTNREYYAKVIIPIENVLELQATVNANLFLRLIAQISTPEIELSVTDNFLVVKGNGLYKLPLIFDGDSFDISNLNRQIYCNEITLGKNKAEVAANYLHKINSNIEIEAFPFFAGSNLKKDFDILNKVDFIFDCCVLIFCKNNST